MDRYVFAVIITLFAVLATALVETLVADCIVLYGVNKKLVKPLESDVYNNLIWKIFRFCILSDILAQVLISVIYGVMSGADFASLLLGGLLNFCMGTRYDKPDSIIFSVFAILLSMVLIFVFSNFIIFKKLDATKKQKLCFSLQTAIFSAPYFILIPFGDLMNFIV
jgi:hypothetical protein